MPVIDWRSTLSVRGFVCLQTRRLPVDFASQLGSRWTGARHLVARNKQMADPWSLSGQYGYGAFPWHTDGAVSTRPPRWLILRPVHLGGQTSTELLEPDLELQRAMRRTTLQVRDRVGRVRYLPAAIKDEEVLWFRWDPRTCSPRTGLTIEEMEQREPTEVITWKEGQLLILDNARILHRRPAVNPGMKRVLERVYVWK